MATDSDWLNNLPKSVRQRFEGIGGYVTSVLEEAGLRESLKTADVQRIQMIAFIRTLSEFLEDGSRAAKEAVTAFSALGAKSFKIGTEVFEEGSPAVTRGSRLAAPLPRQLVAQDRAESDCAPFLHQLFEQGVAKNPRGPRANDFL